MGAITDLWQSERGLVAIALTVACSVLCALSVITPEQWLDYTKWVFVTYAAAKTVTGAVAIATKPSDGAKTQMESIVSLVAQYVQNQTSARRPAPSEPSKES